MTQEEMLEELLDLWEDLTCAKRRISVEDFLVKINVTLEPELIALFRQRITALAMIDQQLATPIAETNDSVVEVAKTNAREIPAAAEVNQHTRFTVYTLHARGGLGNVYLARDHALGRDVALKEIQQRHLEQSGCVARFEFEAQISARLEHPGIIPIYGQGIHENGRPFYTMRFIRGETLRDAIARLHTIKSPATKPPAFNSRSSAWLDLRGVLTRFVAVCNAVGYAHSQGVIHRDLKPSNVMLGPFGETLVLDWGLARVFQDPSSIVAQPGQAMPGEAGETRLTVAGSTLGTLEYMSPEQYEGNSEQIGPASDIFSLGATLYHLLTNQPPYQHKDRVVLARAIEAGQFPRPSAIRRDCPRALESICLKAMALRPEDRYAKATDMAADLERWLADEPVLAHREGVSSALGRWIRRHARFALLSACGCLFSVIVVIVCMAQLALAYQHEAEANDKAQQKITEAEQAIAEAKKQLEEARKEKAEAHRQRQLLSEMLQKALDPTTKKAP
jgi:serine/threonine-protein kinase